MIGSGMIASCPAQFLETFEAGLDAVDDCPPSWTEPVDPLRDMDRAIAEAFPGYLPDYVTRHAPRG